MIPFLLSLIWPDTLKSFRKTLTGFSMVPEVGGATLCGYVFMEVGEGVTSVFKIINLGRVSSTDMMDV